MPRTPLIEMVSSPGPGLEAMLSLDRGARYPEVLGAQRPVVAGLRSTHALLVGAGSIGMTIGTLAGQLGLGSITICDRGFIKAESVLTHPVDPAEIGRAKASLAGERAKAASPDTIVFAFDGPFESLPSSVLAGVDAVLLASDNLSCEVAVTKACTELGVPLIQASVFGPALVGQIRSLVNPTDATGPCLACSYGSDEWKALDRGTRFSCEGGASPGVAANPTRVPTMSLPQLCALTANLTVIELTRRVLGIADPAASLSFDYRGYNHKMTTTKLDRRHDCPMPHAPTRRVPWSRNLSETRLREFLSPAGGGDLTADAVIAVEGYCWCERTFCSCPDHPILGRFMRVDTEPSNPNPSAKEASPKVTGAAPSCPGCGGTQTPHPFYTYRWVPAQLLAAHFDRTLAEIGAVSTNAVHLRGESDSRLFFKPLVKRDANAEPTLQRDAS